MVSNYNDSMDKISKNTCEVKTGIILRRVCGRKYKSRCGKCDIAICDKHLFKVNGKYLCIDCHPEASLEKIEDWRRFHITKSGSYLFGKPHLRSTVNTRHISDSEFSSDDFKLFDQLNSSSELELHESYDS